MADSFSFQHVFTQENPGSIEDFYEFEKKKQVLGEGSYGQVCRGKNRGTGVYRAIKAIDRSKIPNEEKFQQEVEIQQKLDHTNIVRLYEVFKDAKRVYLVMEMCTGGELFDRIVAETERHTDGSAFGEPQCAIYMHQIIGAMHYLHSQHFVHRDIKPENFLMQNETKEAEIKVIDFGLAKEFNPKKDPPMKSRAGTPYYVAPEVLAGKYNEKCDIWSCGVIMYILLCGYPPFHGDNDRQILDKVKKAQYDFPAEDWDRVSQEGKSVIKAMLTKSAADRPSAEDVLNMKWMKDRAKTREINLANDFGARLKKFRNVSKIKKLALTVIAQQLKDDELKQLRETFLALDDNRDGTLSISEIKEGMAKAKVSIPPDLEETILNLDTDGSGTIDYTEFIAATISQQVYMREESLWQAFRTFDKDGDGKITADELAILLGDRTDIAEMISEVDLNKDGMIDFEEFKKALQL